MLVRAASALYLSAILCAGCAEGAGDATIPTATPLTDAPAGDAPPPPTDAPFESFVPDAPPDDTPAWDSPSPDAPSDAAGDAPPDVALDTSGDGPPDAPCVGSCAGKVCADDGCGHPCGACGPGQICQSDTCVCDPALPAGWPASFTPWSRNPVLVPTSSSPNHGADNVYAPDIQEYASVLLMFYGAQGADGHDRIYLAWSHDGAEWRKYPSDAAPAPVLDRGSSNHVNDPSVLRVAGTWRMFYTDAATGEQDRIWLAEGSAPNQFHKTAEVLSPGAAGSWDAAKVGRPSVLLENGEYRMWYDGTANGQRHVGLATSSDGLHFARYAGNPVLLNAGAVDVKKVGNVYVMLRESGDGTYWATSVDGTCWVDRGKLFGLSGATYDAFGQVTPFLQMQAHAPRAVWFGGASVSTWNRNRIAVAWSSTAVPPDGGGCMACTSWGSSCMEACSTASLGATGVCGAPGSTNPVACCTCSTDGCEACRGAAADCHVACVAAGKPGGWCGSPGSTDPAHCCRCID